MIQHHEAITTAWTMRTMNNYALSMDVSVQAVAEIVGKGVTA
jgi:hypothetical protein